MEQGSIISNVASLALVSLGIPFAIAGVRTAALVIVVIAIVVRR